MKRLLQTIGLIAFGAFGTLALDAADFLTQAELKERLAKLRAELPAWIGFVHRDRCYQSAKGNVAYEYSCPTCGHSTGYRDEVGRGCMPGVSNTIAWARESMTKLRALRLDINVDERGFCDRCRSDLKIPDRGEIVQIPDDWPERPTMHVFPFVVGDQVDIYREPYDNIFCIGKRVPDYWVPAKHVTKDGTFDSSRVIPVHVGPDAKYPKIGMTNRWAGGRIFPESETNGWVRFDGNHPYGVFVPKEVVGKLTFAGEKTARTDVKKLRWSINGRSVNIYDRTDILILETFLKGERRLPNWNGPDWDIRSICHMRRLEELLGAKGKVNNWHPAYPLLKTKGAREPHSLTNHPYGEVEVEVDI